MTSSPTQYPCTPKRPTAPRYTYCTTPSPQTNTRRCRTRVPSSPLNDQTPTVRREPTRRVSKNNSPVFTDPRTPQTPQANDPLKSLLRQKFQVRCLERAAKARAEQVKHRRYVSTPSDASSDGYDDAMDDDGEEDDDAIMQDELFRRIVASNTRKERYSYRVSYALEVGSSFDPDMEDVSKWEEELRACPTSSNDFLSSDITASPPEDEEEVAAYAEHLAALAEIEDIPEDELFSWSDFEDDFEDEEEERPVPSSLPFVTEKTPTQPEFEDDDAMCVT